MLSGYYDYDAYVKCLCAAIKTFSLRTSLELGIGTGLVASKLVNLIDIDLLGVDFSKSMLNVCQQNFPEIRTIFGDIATYEFEKSFDLIFSVGGPWYFMENEDRLLFCFHIPEKKRQRRSIENICSVMRQGSVLALAIQGSHVNRTLSINRYLEFSQVVRTKNDGGTLFEKDYIFTESGKKFPAIHVFSN